MIGDFRSPNFHYKGWLEKVRENDSIQITSPKDKETFFSQLGASKAEIAVSGLLRENLNNKILIVVRTDRDYPQALGKAKEDGSWEFSGVTLGGVDHQIYALVVGENDIPLYRSKIVTVRRERKI